MEDAESKKSIWDQTRVVVPYYAGRGAGHWATPKNANKLISTGFPSTQHASPIKLEQKKRREKMSILDGKNKIPNMPHNRLISRWEVERVRSAYRLGRQAYRFDSSQESRARLKSIRGTIKAEAKIMLIVLFLAITMSASGKDSLRFMRKNAHKPMHHDNHYPSYSAPNFIPQFIKFHK